MLVPLASEKLRLIKLLLKLPGQYSTRAEMNVRDNQVVLYYLPLSKHVSFLVLLKIEDFFTAVSAAPV